MLATTARTVRNTATRVMMARGSAPTVTSSLTQQRRNYHENIVEHYENPRNVGSLDKNSDDVGTVSLLLFVISAQEWGVLCSTFWISFFFLGFSLL